MSTIWGLKYILIYSIVVAPLHVHVHGTPFLDKTDAHVIYIYHTDNLVL